MSPHLVTIDGKLIPEPPAAPKPEFELIAFCFGPGPIIATHNGRIVPPADLLAVLADRIRQRLDQAERDNEMASTPDGLR